MLKVTSDTCIPKQLLFFPCVSTNEHGGWSHDEEKFVRAVGVGICTNIGTAEGACRSRCGRWRWSSRGGTASLRLWLCRGSATAVLCLRVCPGVFTALLWSASVRVLRAHVYGPLLGSWALGRKSMGPLRLAS